jgi:ABC-type dipeptide/oligopeptide/nickel transport system ATPase subunit
MVFQDPSASLNPKLSVGTLLDEALSVAGASARTAQSVLSDVGLPSDVRGLYPHQFSGGQKQRVAIARALITHPELVLADEPTANLDSKTSDQIISLMQRLNQQMGVTFIFSTHDPRVMQHAKRVTGVQDALVTPSVTPLVTALVTPKVTPLVTP